MKTINVNYIAIITLSILAVPLLAMQFSSEVNWTLGDFIVMGILLFVSGLVWEFVRSRLNTPKAKLLAGVAVLFVLLYVWAELAVGIFTNIGS